MRALVLSGGGSKGAFQCGALQHLLYDLETQYDIICGVSVGALNAAFLGQFSKGKEKDSFSEMYKLWSSIDTKSIYKRWFPFGSWHAIWQQSLYNSSPLTKLVNGAISLEKIRESQKLVSVGAISLSSGKYTIFNQSDDDFIEAVIASASFPGMLSPVKIRDQWWSDGGIKEITPVKVAIELGAVDIDIICTSPNTRVKNFIEHPTTIDILKRSLDLASDKIMSNDIDKALMYNKLSEAGCSDKRIIKLNLIRPKFNLIDNLLDFNPSKIQEMIKSGYEAAKSKYTSQ